LGPDDRTLTASETSHGGAAPDADETAPTGAAQPAARAPFEPGDRLDRFTVLAELGAGGMGRVVAAYDPRLDRRVAIKVLHARARSEKWRAQAHARLLREAQAMARLSHPNIVTVYEVGQLGDDLFIAMEYVKGATLRGWLEAEVRDWRDVIEVFEQAGRGFAAAHAAGLVHRDVKPDNILVGDDGIVRVTDFGLVGATGADGDAEGESPLSTDLTETGTIVGTPRYMAPEQHRGADVDARTDQFAFGVALYEALYRQRAFAGNTPAELSKEVHAGAVRAAPASDVPPAIHRAVVRALAPVPADRHASMADLLDVLARDPAATRRRALVVAGGLGLVGAAVAATVLLSAPRPSYCAAAGQDAARVWSPARAAELRTAFQATGRAHAETSATFVASVLDRRVADWTAMRTQACEATRVRGEQSEALLDRRMACLDRHLGEVEALVGALTASPAPEVVDRAVRAVLRLRPLDECADAEALMAAVPLPRDPAQRATIAALEDRLARARAAFDLGRYADAKQQYVAIVAEARTLGYAPVLAEALYRMGRTDVDLGKGDDAVAALREAALQAARAKDDHLVAEVWTQLLFTTGDLQGKHADALALRPVVEAAIARAGDAPLLRASYLNDSGVVLMLDGKLAEAKAAHEEALAIRTRELGADALFTAWSHDGLGNTLVYLGDYAGGRTHLERSLAINEQIFGKDHPEVGGRLGNLANALASMNDRDGARALWTRNIDLVEKANGPDANGTVIPRINLAMSYYGEGRYAEAKPAFDRALAVTSKHRGAQHPLVGTIETAMGSIALGEGRFDDARAHYQRAQAIDDARLGPDDYDRAYTMSAIAALELETKNFEAARALIERSLAMRLATLGERHEEVAESIGQRGDLARATRGCAAAIPDYEKALAITEKTNGPEAMVTAGNASRIGECLVELGQHEKALPHLERAAKIAEASGGHGLGRADTELALAQALVATGGDKTRAVRLAESAKTRYSAGNRRERANAAEAWLRAHR
jgi:tetratricopeptide (TPR) repeat protein